MDARHLLQVLQEVLSKPTAPFHEGAIIDFVVAWCEPRGIKTTRDAFGNLLLRTGGEGSAIAFAAHMDHPGFEVTDTSGSLVEARWLGSGRPELFAGAKLEVFSDPPARGTCVRTELHPEGHRVDKLFVDVEGVEEGDYGTWDLSAYDLEGAVVHTRAADDLVGCAAILATMGCLAANKEETPVYGLLTRAEEVGMLGALGAMKANTIHESVPIISVECSKALPSACQGQGPVVRVGDKRSVFDANLCRFLTETATSIQQRHPDFRFQRALMGGGTSESTAYGLFDRATAGIAVPLGNYHNRSDDRSQALAPETIHVTDFFGTVALMLETARDYAQRGRGANERLKAGLIKDAATGLRRLGSDALAG